MAKLFANSGDPDQSRVFYVNCSGPALFANYALVSLQTKTGLVIYMGILLHVYTKLAA